MASWRVLLRTSDHVYDRNCWCTGCIAHEERRRAIGLAMALPKKILDSLKGKDDGKR